MVVTGVERGMVVCLGVFGGVWVSYAVFSISFVVFWGVWVCLECV